ncbi:hypothetical protein F2Q70_00005178 [Brassica cretica]|uniref:uracil phosphoribosyltransferase n=1 Tax=Brassica cretica TaxID=69181 RepID=A0A8S9J0Q7_BRACR|nr:hypothetical protein F2Q70_00005178 [Brassica cretica]
MASHQLIEKGMDHEVFKRADLEAFFKALKESGITLGNTLGYSYAAHTLPNMFKSAYTTASEPSNTDKLLDMFKSAYTTASEPSITRSVYSGVDFCKRLCGVSVIRSGESMENALRACCKGIKIGKILIHREGDNGQQLVYEKLPNDISERHVLLLDPILGTGNSAVQAIKLLISKGVPEGNIIFLNLISAPQGVHVVCKKFPRLKIVTSEIEHGLNEEFRVIPGMGEFGDRYFGTDDD